MTDFPQHKVSQFADSGICLRTVNQELSKDAIRYAHQDDYYMLGLIKSGSYRVSVDFQEYSCTDNELVLVSPGQIHHFLGAERLEATMLMIDPAFVDAACKLVFDEYALWMAPFSVDNRQRMELEHLFDMLSVRLEQAVDALAKSIVRAVVTAIVGIVAQAMQAGMHRAAVSRRSIGLTLQFKQLLNARLSVSRSPSYYASLLHISSLYLNEVVKSVTGLSVSKYIQNELVLRAKRILVYSSKNIQEISRELGVDDYAYFSRLFARSTGMSPSAFRKKYLE